MNELLTKVLLVILGFLLGISGRIIVKLDMERRKRAAIRDMMCSEIDAFIKACEDAGQRKFWDSSTVEYLARHIIQSYTQDRDRFIAASRSTTRQGVYNFYLGVSALLGLIESHRKLSKDTDGSSAAIGPGTYEGIAKRSREILQALR